MGKILTSKKIAALFAKRLEEDNLISDVFDYLGFDCTLRCYIAPDALDEKIRDFYKSREMEQLIAVIDLIQKGKKMASIDEKAFLRDVKQYIVDHLNEGVTVEEVANIFCVSYYYLCHLFKKLANKTVNQFRTEKLLEKAMRLLLETDSKISDVALSCGFDNFSYFSEIFIKHIGVAPSEFRKKYADCTLHPFYEFEDMLLAIKMKSLHFLDGDKGEEETQAVSYIHVHDPSEAFGTFLHEAAIIEYEGVLFASWYNCKERELIGYTPIVGRRSYDGGKTWTAPEVIAEDKSEKILYCPPVYGICDGKLYMLLNQMVSADHMHSLDLYVLNKETDKFERLWSRPIPFKLNTNVFPLPNGKLLLPGRIAELDDFPTTPAVMISDSGKIDAQWRVVKVAENGLLPDGESLVHPETTVICHRNILYMFNRNDKRKVPLVYISNDFGESWSEAMAHDIPYRESKIYSGMLRDGRFYLIANADRFNRSKLVLYLSEKDELKFTKQRVLMDCESAKGDMIKCHYPAAVEKDGMLYIIATADYAGEDMRGRGAILFTVDLSSL
ncbi:MAG: helix-turn-helix domain-containing protein [Clostridia bacterium]|nr:helix-turn-helix domain-containing protein [Clostridia bacterium]